MDEKETLIKEAIIEFGKNLQENPDFQEALEQSASVRKDDRMIGTARIVTMAVDLGFRAGYDFANKQRETEKNDAQKK